MKTPLLKTPKNILILSSVLISMHINAQPVIQYANMLPIGSTATISSGGAITPGSGGASQTWNFSSLSLSSIGSLAVKPPSATPYFSQFIGTNYADDFLIGSTDYYQYFNYNSGVFEQVGQNITGSGGTDWTPDPLTLLSFPFNYTQNVYDNYQSTIMSQPDSVHWVYDGYGTLILSTGTYTNVARLVSYYSGSSSPSDYIWYNTNPIYPILVYTLSTGLTTVISGVVTGVNNLSVNNKFTVSPNPSSGKVRISGCDKISTIQVYNLLGEKVLQCPNNNSGATIDIDLSGAPKGIYYYRLMNDLMQVSSGKLVIQ